MRARVLWMLIVALLLSGLGIAPALAMIFAMTSATVKFSDTAEAYGWIGTGQLIGAALGSAFAGLQIDNIGAVGAYWVAVPFAVLLADTWLNRLFTTLAFSAGAILLERATNPVFAAGSPAIPPHFEEIKPSHELLQPPNPDPGPGPGHP